MEIELSNKHPIQWLKDRVKKVKSSNNIFGKPKIIFILPDNLTINEAKKIVLKNNKKIDCQILYSTFEDLAIKIISTNTGFSEIEIIGPEIRRQMIVTSIKRMKIQNNTARTVWEIIKNAPIKESELIIKEIESEFVEYLRSGLTSGYTHIVKKAIRNLDPNQYLVSKSKEALDFYDNLNKEVRREFKKILRLKTFSNPLYLLRVDLINEANQILSNRPEVLSQIAEKEPEIWISSLSVFDVSLIKFIKTLTKLENSKTIFINSGTETINRLEKRLKSQNPRKRTLNRKTNIKSYIESPDKRRELEEIAINFIQETKKGKIEEYLQDNVIIARDSGSYLNYMEDTMKTYGFPFHVQTRRQLSLTPPFRLIASILDLLVMVKNGIEIEPHQITDPLRLGYNTGRSPLKAEYFLFIESTMARIGGRIRKHKWSYWYNKINNLDNRYNPLIKFVNEVEIKKNVPDFNYLNKILVLFSKTAADWKSPLELNNGFKQYRYETTEQHITSNSGRLFGRLGSVRKHIKATLALEERSNSEWKDIRRAFYSVSSDSTYGVMLKDKNSFKMTDAGISHFNDSKRRYIVGMTANVFPRKPPKSGFIPQEFREEINEQYDEPYLLSPATDYENEKDFFEAAIGPDGSEVITTMSFLTERGNKEEWSPFVTVDDSKLISRLASEITPVQKGKTSSPKIHLRSIGEICREKKPLDNEFLTNTDPRWKNLVQTTITPRLKIIEERIIDFASQTITIPRKSKTDEPYLKDLLKSILSDPAPAFEIDLIEDCPLNYYYYRFLYSFSQFRDKGYEERMFVPEWKEDFYRGTIPPTLRRRHISTKMREELVNIIQKQGHNTSKSIKKNNSLITSYIDNIPHNKMEFFGKNKLKSAIFHLRDNANKITVVSPEVKQMIQHQVWKPYEFKLDFDKPINFARMQARRRDYQDIQEANGLNWQYRRFIAILDGGRSYRQLNETEIDNYIDMIKSLSYRKYHQERVGRCKECIYSTLCGYWGF